MDDRPYFLGKFYALKFSSSESVSVISINNIANYLVLTPVPFGTHLLSVFYQHH